MIHQKLKILNSNGIISDQVFLLLSDFINKNPAPDNKKDALDTMITHYAMFFHRVAENKQITQFDQNLVEQIESNINYSEAKSWLEKVLLQKNKVKATRAELILLIMHLLNVYFAKA